MIAYANYFTDARIKNYVGTLVKAGYEVDVFALGQLGPVSPGVRVFCLMPKVWSGSILPYIVSQAWFFIIALLFVTIQYARRQYKVVHVHNIPDFLTFTAIIPKLCGARIFLDIHDTMPETYATKFDVPLTYPAIRLLRLEERVSAAIADQVITTNDLHKKALVEHGISKDKISIIMNVGNDAIFRPKISAKPSSPFTLIYHGTVAKRLGIDLIIDAVHRAHSLCPNLRLILLGNGDFMSVVKRMIAEFELKDVIEVTDWVPVEKLPDYISMADVGIVGNRQYTEHRKNWMLPVKMLEYAAMEVPTIAPRLKAITQYFDETNAVLYEPDSVQSLADSILDVYLHPNRVQSIRNGLREFNKKYNWPIMERRYLDLIAQP